MCPAAAVWSAALQLSSRFNPQLLRTPLLWQSDAVSGVVVADVNTQVELRLLEVPWLEAIHDRCLGGLDLVQAGWRKQQVVQVHQLKPLAVRRVRGQTCMACSLVATILPPAPHTTAGGLVEAINRLLKAACLCCVTGSVPGQLLHP